MSPELSDEQRNKLSELLRKFSGLFTKTDKSTAAKDECETQDFTGDHAPINQRAYRVSPTERRIIHEEVQKMLDEGIVQPSESPWSSPIVLEAGLKLNSKKCLFAAQEVKILGHLVSSNGVRPDPDKIKPRFIKGFCYLAEPLQSLLKSGVEFHWGPEEVEAFNSLKKALTSDPVLGMYDERASTEIHTDASGYGIRSCLIQIQNNVEKVIAYASRTLTKSRKERSRKSWDEILPFVTFAYNTAKQETTGFTPFYLLHGREAETTLDTMLPFCPNDFDDNNITKIAARAEESRQLARVHTLRAQDKDRRRYDSKHQMVSYAPGDLVWVYTPVRKVGLSEKLLRRYFGPYQSATPFISRDLRSTRF
ncbi:transposon Ty3-I Gag-Pol polyprotein [Trichonephila clavipes]|nr:transposon Ty3-I Gag-Pol polyprotein [Trichonephila clavipes]